LCAAHQPVGLLQHAAEEAVGELLIQKPVTVPGEHRVIPHRSVEITVDEPTEQQIVIELLQQLALATDGVRRSAAKTPAAAFQQAARLCVGVVYIFVEGFALADFM
jgi:hypothetical protein